jgi:hypothetical protein
MNRFLIFFLVLAISNKSFAQSEWDSWNEKYKEIEIPELLRFEKQYADSVDRGLITGKHYTRMETYRFPAKYTGKKREISDSVRSSMKRAYKIFGNPDHLNIFDEIKYEYQFRIGGYIFWCSVQPDLNEPFNKEIKKGKSVYLYCLFLNEHNSHGTLYNSFLISEFKIN